MDTLGSTNVDTWWNLMHDMLVVDIEDIFV